MINNGQKITIRYRLFAEDGSLAASNYDDNEPQEIFMGRGQLMPALEQEINTMIVGEIKKVTLSPECAFGDVRQEFIKQTRLAKIPEKQRTVGNILDMEDAEGHICSARIHAIEQNNVILDFNHPLAGQAVTFEVRLLSIED